MFVSLGFGNSLWGKRGCWSVEHTITGYNHRITLESGKTVQPSKFIEKAHWRARFLWGNHYEDHAVHARGSDGHQNVLWSISYSHVVREQVKSKKPGVFKPETNPPKHKHKSHQKEKERRVVRQWSAWQWAPCIDMVTLSTYASEYMAGLFGWREGLRAGVHALTESRESFTVSPFMGSPGCFLFCWLLGRLVLLVLFFFGWCSLRPVRCTRTSFHDCHNRHDERSTRAKKRFYENEYQVKNIFFPVFCTI